MIAKEKNDAKRCYQIRNVMPKGAITKSGISIGKKEVMSKGAIIGEKR